MKRIVRWHRPACACLVVWLSALSVPAEAGWPRRVRGRPVAPVVRRVELAPAAATVRPNGNAPSPMLGTFYSTPYLIVRGNGPVGGGYRPLGMWNDGSLSLYGPLSSMRAKAAPVVVYSRGYDGVVRPELGTSFSTPNQPELSPLVYPTRANFYGAFPYSKTPPWWPSGINYIDSN